MHTDFPQMVTDKTLSVFICVYLFLSVFICVYLC